MSKSEAVVIESIEVREMLRFLFYLEILNKLSLLQRKHSKYMYARCLNFPCFITYLVACMHAFCMFYLYVSLGWLLIQIFHSENCDSAVSGQWGGGGMLERELNSLSATLATTHFLFHLFCWEKDI